MNDHSVYLREKHPAFIEKGFMTPAQHGFYRDIYALQERSVARFAGERAGLDIPAAGAPPLLMSAKRLIDPGDLPALQSSLEELGTILRAHHPGIDASGCRNRLNDVSAIETALRALLRLDQEWLHKEAAAAGLGTEEYFFILTRWLAPPVIAMRANSLKDLGEITLSAWSEPRCPFCGFLADMSIIVDERDGARYLHCGLCEHRWQYRRIACPVCKNEDQQSLGHYVHEDDPVYRIDYCDQCKGYIKTLRIPKQHSEDRYDPAVENIATAFLDAAAMEMGYSRP